MKEFRPPAVVGERGDRRQHVLIAALAAETGLHPPDRDQRPRRDAVALLDRREQRGLGLLQRTSARDDGRGAALGEKLHRATGRNCAGRDRPRWSRCVIRLHQGADGRGADAFGPGLLAKLPLPGLETGRPAAALRGIRRSAGPREDRHRRQHGRNKLPAPDHRKLPFRPRPGRNTRSLSSAAHARDPWPASRSI